MDNVIKEQIKFKINDIDKLFSEYDLIFKKIETQALNEDLYLKLREYATFRHFYRHAYSFQLNWEKMNPLIDNLHMVWNEVKINLENFINE